MEPRGITLASYLPGYEPVRCMRAYNGKRTQISITWQRHRGRERVTMRRVARYGAKKGDKGRHGKRTDQGG